MKFYIRPFDRGVAQVSLVNLIIVATVVATNTGLCINLHPKYLPKYLFKKYRWISSVYIQISVFIQSMISIYDYAPVVIVQ